MGINLIWRLVSLMLSVVANTAFVSRLHNLLLLIISYR